MTMETLKELQNTEIHHRGVKTFIIKKIELSFFWNTANGRSTRFCMTVPITGLLKVWRWAHQNIPTHLWFQSLIIHCIVKFSPILHKYKVLYIPWVLATTKTALMYKMTDITTLTKRRGRGRRLGTACSVCVCVWRVRSIAHTRFWSRAEGRVSACVQLHLLNTTNTVTQLVTGLGCEWCYLVISRKLRRVERSSRRLICLWHWLQKKSSASSLRKLWKQSGRGAGALERGKYGGK